MSDFVIDTTAGTVLENKCRDPYDHLDANAWVDKQIEYGSSEENISGKGLVPYIKELTGNLVGCEIGVCHGFTTEYMLKNIPNIQKIYAVDHYPAFVDWDGSRLTRERQDEIKRRCEMRLAPFNSVEFVFDTSDNFSSKIEDGSLDFVFVDGDHSYDATLNDITNYWPKVKSGGIFAGHDINLQSVRNAIEKFFKNTGVQIKVVENNAWFLIKD